ncbi:MAG TPA: ABC transporter permease subunit [bacterium]|nr:ABC transporter permease subunit [bacterium]
MKPRDFAVDPSYLLGPELLGAFAWIMGGLVLGLWLKTLIKNGRAGGHLTRFTFLDILRTRLYWVIVGCSLVLSITVVLVMFLKAYPEMQNEGMSGIEVVAGLYLFSDTPTNIPTPADPAAQERDLLEGVTLLTTLILLGFYVFFGSLLAIFIGMGLLANELDRRSIYTLISKPLDRMMIFFGKLGGCYLALTVYAVLLWVVDAGLLLYFGIGLKFSMLPAYFVASIVPLTLAALTLYLSTIAKPLVAGFWAIVLMFASNNFGTGMLAMITKSVLRLEDQEVDWFFLLLPPQRPVGLYAVNFLITEPLTRFFVTRAFPITSDPSILALPVVYLAAILLIAYATFSRKEFN